MPRESGAPQLEEAALSGLRFCLSGGNVVPEPLIRAWPERGVSFQQGYGLTEAAPLALLLDKDDVLTKIGSAGRPPFLTEVRVVRPDMIEVEVGEIGEIVVRGPNVTGGYWNQPELTETTATHGGWLHTGDAARLDAEGHVYMLSRIRDLLPLGGETVHPVEVENVLAAQPQLAECAVVRTQGEEGEGLVAFVVLQPGAAVSADVLRASGARDLPPARVPRQVVFVAALPRNANGELLRDRLAEALEEDERR